MAKQQNGTSGETPKKKGHPFRNGFLLGTVVGVGLGLLYAPRPGRKTREALRERMDRFPEEFDEFQTTVREALIDLNTVFKNWRAAKQQQLRAAFGRGREAAEAARADLQREYAQRVAGGPPPGVAGGPPPGVAGGPPAGAPTGRPSGNGAEGESRNGASS
ncbi:MAG: YtxH domain-containing protein [Chloroflexota bacterium]|nr:YtxH domain-containing protein [Dehalococcoidia bacterium]MDW8253236.1 YtxH domain-containing protein [Chloroflexota bacterium]